MIHIYPDLPSMSLAAAEYAASLLRSTLQHQPSVRLVAATGESQLAFLRFLSGQPGIEWERVELFHLDEYVGIGSDHPASFARYIRTRIIEPLGVSRYHLLNGMRPPEQVIVQASAAIAQAPVDLAFVGIGENAHLAFNDPPADFESEQPYLLVELDRDCRQQQVNEGWFDTLAEVPSQAISMSVRQILRSNQIVCVVPGIRKAPAVKASLENPVTPDTPASILRTHSNATIFLDAASASQLNSPDQLLNASLHR